MISEVEITHGWPQLVTGCCCEPITLRNFSLTMLAGPLRAGFCVRSTSTLGSRNSRRKLMRISTCCDEFVDVTMEGRVIGGIAGLPLVTQGSPGGCDPPTCKARVLGMVSCS
jgi:hypothetical protein